MAKKKSPVDAALEVARKVRVPKKPVKAKGKKTVPTKLDWGRGIPEDKLAYLNDDEMALVQAKRGYKGKRSVDGIPAFPDPGDTAAGDNSHLPDSGGGAGTRGDGGGPGGPNGPNSSSSSASGGSGGQSSSSSSADKSKTTTSAAPSSGPSGGPTSAPARTEPSRVETPSNTFGPRTSNLPGTPVSTAPSMAAYEGALNRIAQGSSIVGGYPGNKIQDRVPQAAPSTVKYSQSMTTPTPTAYGPSVAPVGDPFQQRYAKVADYLGSVSPTPKPSYQPSDMMSPMRSVAGLAGPNQGLGYSPTSPAQSVENDIFAGANSPFASPSVTSFDVEKYNNPATYASSPMAGLLGPSVPAGTAGYTKAQMDARYPGAIAYQSGAYPANVQDVVNTTLPTGVNPNLYSAPVGPSLASALNLTSQQNVFSAPTEKLYTDRIAPEPTAQRPGQTSYIGQASIPTSYTPGDYEKYRTAVENEALARASISNILNGVSPSRVQSVSAPATSPTAYGPTVGTVEDPYNQRYAKAATYIGGIHPANYGSTPSVSANQPTELNVLGYPESRSPSQEDRYDTSPSQQAAYDTSPSQESGWTDAQRDAYLNSISGGHSDKITRPTQNKTPKSNKKNDTLTPAIMPPLPEWNDYNYVYTDYPAISYAADPRIINFNNYSATLKRGGRVGDSVDAAIRLARQSIVSRPKTR